MSSKIIDENAPPIPSPRRRAIRLESARDCRRFLARIVNLVYRNEMDAGKASRLAYVTGIILRSAENEELEQRARALEKEAAMTPEDFARKIAQTLRLMNETVPDPTGREGERQG